MPSTKEEVLSESKLQEPSLYRVILHNDDYTTMEFVIDVLKTIFHKNSAEAEDIMWKIHTEGRGVCGVYTKEIAETKAEQVKSRARQNGFPLLATIEKDG